MGIRTTMISAALSGMFLLNCTQADRLVIDQPDADALHSSSWLDFSAPTRAEGLLGQADPLHDPSLPADELELYLSMDPGTGAQILKSSRLSADASWVAAQPVAELASAGNDLDPDVSLDGLTLYFSSDRSGAGYRLYVVRRVSKADPWGVPEAMPGLGSATLDQGPSVDPTGLYMIFASQRGTSDIRLYAASRSDPLGAWQTVEALSAIDSGKQDQNPALFNQSRSLMWSSRRRPDADTSDLYQADRAAQSDDFSGPPSALQPLNSLLDWEGDPWVSQDGHHMFFVSDRASGVPQIYEAWR